MTRPIKGDGWSLVLPDAVTGGPLAHTHTHLRTMALCRGRAEDGSELEVIVTTYPGAPIGEHGERLDDDTVPWDTVGARVARRRDQVTQLDVDAAVAPVESIVIVASGRSGGSACLVVHRPLGAPTPPSDAVVESFALEPA